MKTIFLLAIIALFVSCAQAQTKKEILNNKPEVTVELPAISAEDFFTKLTKDNLETVDQFYDLKATFKDPAVDLTGRDAIRRYYKNLYANVKIIKFEFNGSFWKEDTQILLWKMILEHPSLKGGDPITVDGVSHIRYSANKKAIYHRDFFDMGEFMYENIPVLGFLVRKVKNAVREQSIRE